MEVKVTKGDEVIETGMAERIIELDKRNMQAVLEKAGIEFPESNRRRGFEGNPTFIIATEGDDIVGYLQYGRSWDDPDYLYISSIQIDKKYRNSRLILLLMDRFRSLASEEDFLGIRTNVQKSNLLAVRMYKKIGFRLRDNPDNDASLVAEAGRELLTNSPVVTLIDKSRDKTLL